MTNIDAEQEKAQILKKIYELGFEVGLKNHSEIGWVLREYNDLITKALKMGIKVPDCHYADGKVKGKASKDTGGIGGQKASEKADVFVKKLDLSSAGLDTTQETENSIDHPSRKPSMNDIPKFVKKSGETELPMFLEGFKPSKRK